MPKSYIYTRDELSCGYLFPKLGMLTELSLMQVPSRLNIFYSAEKIQEESPQNVLRAKFATTFSVPLLGVQFTDESRFGVTCDFVFS